MNIIITVALILGASYLASLAAKKVNMPSVVALIILGLLINIPVIKGIIIEPNTEILVRLGDFAILGLMFLAGLESSWRMLKIERRDSFIVSVTAALTPFLIGFLCFMKLGYSFSVSAIMGVCLSITAEGTTVKMLMEMKKLKTKIGTLITEAGLFDDMLGFFIFFLITYFLKEAYIKEDLLLAGAILAFFAGVSIKREIGKKRKAIHKIEDFISYAIIPFFFVSICLPFDYGLLKLDPFLVLFVIVIGLFGKIAGTTITKAFTRLKWNQIHLVGWAMNSRGGVDLALAIIAVRAGLLPTELYSSLIITALVTTLIFPFVMIRIMKKNPKVMG